MPEDDDLNDEDLVPRSQIRQLEEKAKKAGDAEARATEAERKLAFYEALGATTASDPKLQYFIDGYKGELTTEAIKAEAVNAGFIGNAEPKPATTDPQNQPTAAEMAAQARMQAAAEGAGGNRPVDLIEAFGPRGSKTPEEILEMCRAAGRRISDDMQ